MLAAAHGDGIWIEYGDPKKPTRILLDGGPASTYEKGLRARVARAAAERPGPVRFELFVVTHIDADHIDVPLILLRDSKVKCSFRDIWFNGWSQIAPDDGQSIFAPLQGEFLTSILGDDAAKLPWNKEVGGRALGVPDDAPSPLPAFKLPGGMRLTLLSPGTREVNRLRARWESAIRDFSPGDFEEARLRLEKRKDYEPPDVPPIFGTPAEDAPPVLGGDRTPANGSSIAMLAEFDGCAVLLAGDAHARVLAQNLRRLAVEREVPTIQLDAFKLPHHGSQGNLTPEVLAAVTCSRFLFSTSGAQFGHPDEATVKLILDTVPGPVELYFNYRKPTTERFEAKEGDRQRTVYGIDGAITLELDPE